MTEELIKKIIESIGEMNSEYAGRVVSKFIEKSEGDSYTGIWIKADEVKAVAVLNLDSMYLDYLNGLYDSWDHFIEEIINTLENASSESIDFDFKKLEDYNYVKELLFPTLVPNKKVVPVDTVHTDIGDISVVYRVCFEDGSDIRFFTINEKILKTYGVSKEQLHEDAIENLSKTRSVRILNLGAYCGMGDDPDGGMVVTFDGDMSNGASAILIKGVARSLYESVGEYYVIPSSTDEVIIVPNSDRVNEGGLRAIIEEVSTKVCDEKIYLSSSLYKYDSVSDSIVMVD